MKEQNFRANGFIPYLVLQVKQWSKNQSKVLLKELLTHWIEVALLISFIGSAHKNQVRFFSFPQVKKLAAEQAMSEPMNTSLLAESEEKPKDDGNWGNTYSNLVYTEGDFATDDKARAKAIKRAKQKRYIEQFMEIAQHEMQVHGIPASITLAQGLLESNVGESKLAVRNNNHFGLKCFSKTCKRGHCSNFEDDSHKDFFRKFKSAKESYDAHSKLLQKPRYRALFDLERTDYVNWAHGLKKAGYATDPKYGYKLINLIKDLDLTRFDTPKKEEAAD